MLINTYCYCVRNITLFPEESDHACSHGHATIGGGRGMPRASDNDHENHGLKPIYTIAVLN